jgi:hypothetical protein
MSVLAPDRKSICMDSRAPTTSGWQRCPNCFAVAWITRQLAVRDERLALVWVCPNCHGEWLSAGEDDDPDKTLFVKR